MVEAFRPSTILVDLGMPDPDGYQVARRVRQMPGFAAVRLIAISGYDAAEDRLRYSAAGFDHHLAKPVTLSTLQKLFAEAVHRH